MKGVLGCFPGSHPLLNKIIVCIFLFGAVMASSFTLLKMSIEYDRKVMDLNLYLDSLEESQLQVLAKNIWSYNQNTVILQLNSILLHPDILFVELDDANDNLYTVGQKPKQGIQVLVKTFPLFYNYRQKDVFVGEFRVHAVTENIRKVLLTQLPAVIALEFFKMFLVCTFILIIFYFFFSRHLQEIAVQAKVIDFDNLEHPLILSKKKHNPVKPDELDLIVSAINEMKHRLQEGIDEREKMGAELRQAQKLEAIGTLAGGIAHDFNNILAVIFGYTELAMMDLRDIDKLKNHLQQVDLASIRARDLVQQILTFSRKSEHTKRPLRMSLIVKEAAKMLRSSIPSTIEIREQIGSGDKYVLADPTQMHQVMMNLCTNAYHAMRETGGVLGIKLQEKRVEEGASLLGAELAVGNYLELEISDNGAGMNAATREKIFEPYFTTKELGGGTGLGLAVVHGIVKEHHGMIHVYSELGQGTTFRVFFPTVADDDSVDQETHATLIPSASENLHILYVDDEEQILDIAQEGLSNCGYRISTYRLPEEALAAFQKSPDAFDMLITDMTMPGMTGADLAKQVLVIRPELPVILCTGYSELINKESALALGCKGYVSKPVTMSKLTEIIENVCVQKNMP